MLYTKQMSKIIRYARGISKFIVIALVLLNVFNLAWLFGAKDLYWPTYSKIAQATGWTLISSNCLLLPIVFLSALRLPIKVLVISIMSVMACFELMTISTIPVYVDEITANNKTFILAKYGEDHGGTCYQLLECKADKTECQETKPELDDCTVNFDPYIMTSGKTGGFDVFFNGALAYTYGARSYSYEFRDAVIYKNDVYWTVQARHETVPLFVFGRCDEATRKSCEILQTYSKAEFQHMNLATDAKGNELFILFDGKLTHMFGNMSETFDVLASASTEHSLMNGRPSTYNVAVYKNTGKYTYVLYECNARYFWCEIYPFYYVTPEKQEAMLSIDDAKRELSIYINETLISTWNELPVCHVEGCIILEK
jgi:hypothetical protein